MAAADLAPPTSRNTHMDEHRIAVIMDEFSKSLTKITEEHFSKMRTIFSENQKQMNKLFEQCFAVINDGAGEAHCHEDPHFSAPEQSDNADPDDDFNCDDADVLSGLEFVEDENGLNAEIDETDVVSAEQKNSKTPVVSALDLFDESPKKNGERYFVWCKISDEQRTLLDCVHDTYKLDLEGNDLVYKNRIVSTFGAFPRVKLKFNVLFEQCFKQCKTQLVAPVLRNGFDEFRNNATMSLVEVLRQGFPLNYIIDEVACSACVNSNGLCGSLTDSKRFQCLCRDGAYPVSCPKHGAKMKVGVKVGNDDIQGTASVVLAVIMAALKLVNGSLAEQKFIFLGAGEAGTGIAELIALKMSKQTGTPLEEARKHIWLVDSKGLVVSSRFETLQHFKKPWAHEHEPIGNFLDVVKAIKPTVLIGSSGVGRTFTKDVVQAMASFIKKPVIFALSNPTSRSECTAEEAYAWSKGRAIYASGSPVAPVEFNGKIYVSGQANNAYIFPGLGLGLIISGAIRVHDDMLLAASEALAAEVTQANFDKGLIFPPFNGIRKISAHIAAKVAAKAYELGLATNLPQPKDLVAYAESCMYSPSYRSYR